MCRFRTVFKIDETGIKRIIVNDLRDAALYSICKPNVLDAIPLAIRYVTATKNGETSTRHSMYRHGQKCVNIAILFQKLRGKTVMIDYDNMVGDF